MSSMFEDLFEILKDAIANYQVDPIPFTEKELDIIKNNKKDFAYIAPTDYKFQEEPTEEEYEQSNPYVTPNEINRFIKKTGLTKTHLLRYIRISKPTFLKFMDFEKINDDSLNKLTNDFRKLKHNYNKQMNRFAS